MKLSRAAFFSLLLAFALLFVQQAGAVHSISHAFEDLTRQQQKDKEAPHSNACEQCAIYAQLGSALSCAFHSFAIIAVPTEAALHHSVIHRSLHILAAAARGPPALLQTIA
ncbi:MAG: hypothetical protein PHT15_08840 [Gallionellaceae bacterium]|nr:hypothetical protein [Gallionellaceae bacterium]